MGNIQSRLMDCIRMKYLVARVYTDWWSIYAVRVVSYDNGSQPCQMKQPFGGKHFSVYHGKTPSFASSSFARRSKSLCEVVGWILHMTRSSHILLKESVPVLMSHSTRIGVVPFALGMEVRLLQLLSHFDSIRLAFHCRLIKKSIVMIFKNTSHSFSLMIKESSSEFSLQ